MMRLFIITLIFVVAISDLLTAADAGRAGGRFDDMEGFGYKSTREEVLATRDSRKERLIGMIQDMDEQLEDHNTGRRRLHEGDLTRLEKRKRAYRMKLETIQGELDDRDVDRILAREDIRAEMHRARRSRRQEL